jgi:hypothetical protein
MKGWEAGLFALWDGTIGLIGQQGATGPIAGDVAPTLGRITPGPQAYSALFGRPVTAIGSTSHVLGPLFSAIEEPALQGGAQLARQPLVPIPLMYGPVRAVAIWHDAGYDPGPG